MKLRRIKTHRKMEIFIAVATIIYMVAVASLVNVIFDGVEEEIKDCGGIARCAGSAAKDIKSDFTKGMQ